MINPLQWIINKSLDKYNTWHKKYYSVEATCKREGYISWSAYECLLENIDHLEDEKNER
jgi:hypothetical protein